MAASSVKVVAESAAQLNSVPSNFTYAHKSTASDSDSLPTIDFSVLVSGNPDQRSRVIEDLAKACTEWGFFILINHGVPESIMKTITDASLEFFDLPDEEKQQYETKHVSDPIKYGSGKVINCFEQKIHLWRDYFKAYVHPEFHSPTKPHRLRDILYVYSERTRKIARELLRGISESLGLEEGYIDQAFKLDSSFQLFAANYYPRCPQPNQSIGIPGHTDHGLLTFLIHNGVAGLQIEHNGEWFNADAPPNSILVNTADQLEIFSNGRFKSVKHRAVVNDKYMRISIVMANGPSPDTIIGPAPQLVERDGRALYRSMKHIEYVETQQSNRLHGKTNLEMLKIVQD